MVKNIHRNISIFSAIMILLSFVLVLGIAVGKYQIWPYKILDDVYTVAKSLIKYGEIVPTNRLLKVSSYISREKITIHNRPKILPGYYAWSGWDDVGKTYAVWVYSHDFELINYIPVDYYALDQDGPWNNSDSPHAFNMLTDGSFIISFDEGDIMARIDSCGKDKWIKKGIFHHSLQKDDDDTFWTWKAEGSAYGHFNYLVNFDADTGETIKEIGLVEDIIANTSDHEFYYGVRKSFDFKHIEKTPVNKEEIDIFHPNDIDVLTSQYAKYFPEFNQGDLMISLRNTHLVAVIDRNTYKTKWAMNGPWRFQHDPDFTEDGDISIYNNNTGVRRSEIIRINPQSKIARNDLHAGNSKYYSPAMGKHQYLPNGNILIVNPGEGRFVEVDSKGDLVFEFNNISSISKYYNVHIANAQWLPEDYFIKNFTCDSK